jgi:hypothetical protein
VIGRPELDAVLDLAGPPGDLDVLDVGCGGEVGSERMASTTPRRIRWTGSIMKHSWS